MSGRFLALTAASRYRLLPALAVLALAVACATQPAPPSVVTGPVGTEECIFPARVSEWAELDREHLIVYAQSGRVPYLVTLSFPSNDLAFDLGIGVLDSDHDGRICGRGFDSILIPHGTPDRITILSVRLLTKLEADTLLAKAHPKKAAKGKVVPVPDAGGAAATPPAT